MYSKQSQKKRSISLYVLTACKLLYSKPQKKGIQQT